MANEKVILKGRQEIARYIFVSPATLGRHLNEIPHWRVGRFIFSDTESLDLWMRETTKGATKDAAEKNNAADRIQDTVSVPQMRETVQSLPRPLRRVRGVQEEARQDKRRTVRVQCRERDTNDGSSKHV